MSLQNVTFPVQMEFRLSVRTEIRVTDAHGQLLAVVKEKLFSVRDEVRIYADEAKRQQLYSIKAKGFLAGAMDWKAQRLIVAENGRPVGALGSQGVRTLWGAAYDLTDGQGQARYTIRDDKPWMSLVENAVDAIPFVGNFLALGFDYLVNPTYTVRDTAGTEVARISKNRSLLSRRFTVRELRPIAGPDAELLLTGLIQLVLRERDRG